MVCKNTERGIRVGNICYNVTIDVVDDGADDGCEYFGIASLLSGKNYIVFVVSPLILLLDGMYNVL